MINPKMPPTELEPTEEPPKRRECIKCKELMFISDEKEHITRDPCVTIGIGHKEILAVDVRYICSDTKNCKYEFVEKFVYPKGKK